MSKTMLQQSTPPPPPLSSYKRWDSNGDGVIDAADFLATFDQDGDGKLERGELDMLGTELSSQLDMNNQLLSQIKTMEEDKVAASKELQLIQDRFSKLLSSNSDMKEELNETKRKLRVSQGSVSVAFVVIVVIYGSIFYALFYTLSPLLTNLFLTFSNFLSNVCQLWKITVEKLRC